MSKNAGSSLPVSFAVPAWVKVVCALSLAGAGCVAHAQTGGAAAAPAASAAEAGLAKGSGTSRRPILTRDELRVCFAQEEQVRKRLEATEAERLAMNQEKTVIVSDQKALQADRAAVDDAKKQASDFSARLKAYSERVESWNQRTAAFNEDKKTGADAERTREALNKEREGIASDGAALEADKTRINEASKAAVSAFNTKAVALDSRVKSWNERNAKLNVDSANVEAERKTWVSECSDRRYREEDEAAIRAGK